jgi:hypothetical protein
MTDRNMELWRSVEKTDPKHVREITGKPYKGNSPKPYWLIQRATEVFGPCGIGWGVEIVNERVEDGAAGDRVHIAHVRVWYEWKGKRGQVEHVGQTMFAGKRNNGNPYTDEDAPKKSVTDAIVKALSLIGFAGDIFIGRFDDSKYVQEVRQEFNEAPSNGNAKTDEPPQPPRDAIKGAEKMLRLAAPKGRDALEQAWRALGKDTQEALRYLVIAPGGELIKIAREADERKKAA